MPALQTRLLPDPQPLVERLGREFFLGLPAAPGVYYLHDEAEQVLYVGKALNLRKRLRSYRVANPDRLPRRLLRLLHHTRRIHWEICPDEAAALAREKLQIRSLQPRFNRAGVWPASPRYIGWRTETDGLELALLEMAAPGWSLSGPLGGGSRHVFRTLARLIWYALHPERGLGGLPAGWLRGGKRNRFTVPWLETKREAPELATLLDQFFSGDARPLGEWLTAGTSRMTCAFGRDYLQEELEFLLEYPVDSPASISPPVTNAPSQNPDASSWLFPTS